MITQRVASVRSPMHGVADHDAVVSAWMNRFQSAFDECDRPIQHRRAVLPKVVGERRELVIAAARKGYRYLLLILTQIVDAETSAGGDRGQRFGPVIDASQELRRIER